MELILQTLGPLAVLIALGSALAHIRFLGESFINDLNKLAFWVALPALLFTSSSKSAEFGIQVWLPLAVMISGSLLIAGIAWMVSYGLRLPDNARGTLTQSAFRGNLAYIGLPVLISSLATLPPGDAQRSMASAVVVVVLTMAFYNVLAVIVLQISQHSKQGINWALTARSVATNPLLLAGSLGIMMSLTHLTIPSFLQKALASLGAASIPIALLSIGGSLVIIPRHGKHAGIVVAALMKTALLPLIVFGLGRLAGLDPEEQRLTLVLSACPTAGASFIMAQQMGGDVALASNSIALSTVLSAFSLAIALWVTR